MTPEEFPYKNNFASGQNIELTAVPGQGYSFASWYDNINKQYIGYSQTVFVSMTCAQDITANFITVKHQISTISSPESGGEIILNPPQPPDGYEFGTKVTVTAKPASGYAFQEWQGSEVDISTNKFSYIVTSDKNITALFVEKQSNNIWIWVAIGAGVVVVAALIYVFTLRKR